MAKTNHRYAFSISGNSLEYSGRIVRETAESIEIELFDAVLMVCGLGPNPTGELKLLPRERCRLFGSIEAFADAYNEAVAVAERNRH